MSELDLYNETYCKYCNKSGLFWAQKENGKWAMFNKNKTRHLCRDNPLFSFERHRKNKIKRSESMMELFKDYLDKSVILKNGLIGHCMFFNAHAKRPGIYYGFTKEHRFIRGFQISHPNEIEKVLSKEEYEKLREEYHPRSLV